MSPARKEPDLDTYGGRCGARLRELRDRKGLRQSDVADHLKKKGIRASYGAVSRWEKGESDPPFNVLPVLAKLYGIKKINSLLAEK